MSREPAEISIAPGCLHIARRAAILQTILGSCVGVTFWYRPLAVGALCHAVLPKCPAGCYGDTTHRYADSGIRFLAEQFDLMGAPRENVEVKLFGGADVLVMSNRTGQPTIGAQNCRTALEVLELEGFRVTASDLSGKRGRSIRFHTGTGVVLVQRLGGLTRAASDAAPVRRRGYREGRE
jgi:chemotaxis protein CheD